ncbi:hypothetical protein BGZ59_009346 [Podila verticillata]|nr:hypothetical protein BGZ59_009346 [Podila verticillata]KAI9235687.1 MAG: hypothetical protein BYD32DRAFT_488666 [Podila humilis]KFH63632.1 hypothetical protein MVEG_10326 [Podila verticillata NRRL 6337]
MKPLLLSLIATALVAAQTGPESVTRASFTSGENQKLYINGGHTQTVGMKAVERPGFFSLDLSTAWSKATPAWKTLDALPRISNQTGESNIILSKDGATLYVSKGLNFIPYTLATGFPHGVEGMDEDMGTNFTLGPIRDTDSGKLYGAGACRIDNSTIYGVKPQCVLSTYDPLVGRVLKTSSFSGLEFGHGDLPSVQGVYSSSTKLLYFLSNSTDFAGVSGNKATISQYDDTTRSVKATGSTGETPDARGGACFASAFDGTKIVLAGGLKQTSNSTFNAVQSDVYIFDIATAVWTRLKDAPSAFAYGVCAVSSNHLIIYGGYSEYTASVHGSIVYREDGSANGTIAYNNAISILDLKTNTWVDEYKPSADAPQSSALSVFGDMKSLMYSSALALSVVVSLL